MTPVSDSTRPSLHALGVLRVWGPGVKGLSPSQSFWISPYPQVTSPADQVCPCLAPWSGSDNCSFRHQGLGLFWLNGQIVTILGCANNHPASLQVSTEAARDRRQATGCSGLPGNSIHKAGVGRGLRFAALRGLASRPAVLPRTLSLHP